MANPGQPNLPNLVTALATGLTYDMGGLSPASQVNARSGLKTNDLTMVRCYEQDDLYCFELQERVRVAIGPDDSTCSLCSPDNGRVCKHVWWINDHILYNEYPEKANDQSRFEVSRDGTKVRLQGAQGAKTFHDLMDLDDFAAENRIPNDTEIVDTVTDLLSAFEPDDLFWRHGQVHFTELQQQTQALFHKYSQAIIDQVGQQPGLLVALRTAVSDNEREKLQLTKLQGKLDRAFAKFRNWVDHQSPADGDLVTTAMALRTEIDDLCSMIEHRESHPVSTQIQRQMVEILLFTLEKMLEHAGDVYNNTSASTPPYANLHARSRDLVCRMTGHDDTQQKPFVLHALRLLNTGIVRSEEFHEKASRIADLLQRSQAPDGYVHWFQRLLGLL